MAVSGFAETLDTKVKPETGAGNRLDKKEPKGGYQLEPERGFFTRFLRYGEGGLETC